MRYRLVVVTDEPPLHVERLRRNLEKFGALADTLGLARDLSDEFVAETPSVKQA